MAIRLEGLLASFRRHLRAAAKAPRTIELYSQSVLHFGRWLTLRGRGPVLDELTRHAIAAWLAELAETCEPSIVGTRLRGMRRFCRWLDPVRPRRWSTSQQAQQCGLQWSAPAPVSPPT
ncbi:phage integrase N-terminal SAM-like domain-containing protein [Geodermatophilus sp. SYSU D00742]